MHDRYRAVDAWVRRLLPATPPAILLGVGSPNDLSMLRSFARRGIPVLHLVSGRLIGSFSRFGVRVRMPPVEWEPEEWLGVLDRIASALGSPAVLFALMDEHCELVARHAERLRGKLRFVVPDAETCAGIIVRAEFRTFTTAPQRADIGEGSANLGEVHEPISAVLLDHQICLEPCGIDERTRSGDHDDDRERLELTRASWSSKGDGEHEGGGGGVADQVGHYVRSRNLLLSLRQQVLPRRPRPGRGSAGAARTSRSAWQGRPRDGRKLVGWKAKLDAPRRLRAEGGGGGT